MKNRTPKAITVFIISFCLSALLFTTGHTTGTPEKPLPGKRPPIHQKKPPKNFEKKEMDKPAKEPALKQRGGFVAYMQKMKRKDAVIPLMAQLTQRYLSDSKDKNNLDEIFERVLKRHPKMKRELLEKFVEEYNAIPQNLKRQKFVMPDVQTAGKASTKALTDESVKQLFQKAYPDYMQSPEVRAQTQKAKMPASNFKKWKDEPFGDTEVMAIDYVERPVINKILNSGYEPGETVEIHGRNFQSGRVHKIVMTYKKVEDADPEYYEVAAISDNKINFTLPNELIAGKYNIQVQAPGMLITPGDHTPISEPCSYTVDCPKYKVYFNKMKCIDETRGPNNEKIYKDSLVTLWGIAADERAWFVHSRKYTNFEDGTVQSYDSTDKTLLTPDDNYNKVNYAMGMEIDLYEWNWTDVDSGDCEEILDWTYDWFEEMNTDGAFGIGYLFDLINLVLSPVINLFVNLFTTDPRLIEAEYVEYSYLDLQQRLNHGDSIIENITFKGQDGEYQLTYTIMRQ